MPIEDSSEVVQYYAADLGADMEALSPSERAVVNGINQRVAAAESVEGILRFYLDALRGHTPCDRIGIAFMDETGQRLTSTCNVADYERIVLGRGFSQDLAGSSLETVVKSRMVRIINDLQAYLRQHPDSTATKLILREGIRANMTCPLRVGDRDIGVLFRSTREPGAYTAHHVRLHLAVAERLSQAAQKTHRIEQLEAENHAYTEMLAYITHELKSPVASIMTDAVLLREGYLGDITEAQERKIAGIHDKGEYLLELIGDYLDLARVEGGRDSMKLETIADLKDELLQAAIDIIQPQAERKKMRIETELPSEPITLTADPHLLKIVLVNLLGNAVKYGYEETAVRLSVESDAERVTFRVWNAGPGFREEQKTALFKRFSRLDTPALRREKGTGVGLYTCWNIVRRHAGRIWADSAEGEWAEFSFWVPRRPPQDGSDQEDPPLQL